MSNINKVNQEKKCKEYYVDNDYPVDIVTNIPPELRSKNPLTAMPAGLPNGGLYRGPQINKWYVPKEVIPTTTYFNQVLLRNTDPAPPPGATEQYPGNQRIGNNYTAMPGINWYNSAYPRNSGPFNIKVSDPNFRR